MSESKYTWDDGGPAGRGRLLVASDKRQIAVFYSNNINPRASSDFLIAMAAPEMLAALTKLSNEVLGSLPLMEPLARREFGNTNYSILIQRAEEARAVIAKATGAAS